MATRTSNILAPETFKILQPREYIRQHVIAQGTRPDKRAWNSVRDTTIRTGVVSTANASSLVKIGETTVICGIKVEVGEPKLDRPNHGFIIPNIDLPAMCSPRIRPGPPGELPQSLSEQMNQVLHRCKIIDTKDLCISSGNAVWVLYCDVVCLGYDGNAFDASLIAIMAALRQVRVPNVLYSEADGTVKETSKPVIPLRIHRIPVSLTVGIFEVYAIMQKNHLQELANCPLQQHRKHLLVDPTDDEEQVLSATVTTVIDEIGMMCGSFQDGEPVPRIYGYMILVGLVLVDASVEVINFLTSQMHQVARLSTKLSWSIPKLVNKDIITFAIRINSQQARKNSTMTTVTFGSFSASPAGHVLLAEKPIFATFATALPSSLSLPSNVVNAAVQASQIISEGTAETITTFVGDSKENRGQVSIGSIPIERSRSNGFVRTDSIYDLALKLTPKTGDIQITVLLSSLAQTLPAGLAIARAFPLYSRKNLADPKPPRTVHVNFVICNSTDSDKEIDYASLQLAANGVRFAARLGDTPPSELHTDAYVEEVKSVARKLEPNGVELTLIRGDELRDAGLGGIWNVGKGAEHPPALAILGYRPAGAKTTLAMVGKGVTFDTGGLSLKPTASMISMKTDMCGSAACLAAFEAIVLKGAFKENLYAVLCIVENSVDERSYRNDDILYMYSGKTVEVNNTDAEGRLILADGIAYATKNLNPDRLVELSTLTGAQSYATGTRHAGCLSNSDSFESEIVSAGKRSGDLVYPLLYCPEWLGPAKQFPSDVADMKNSVKDRVNAPSSCAGHFLESHFVGDDWNENRKGWAHLDIASPSASGERCTGYGVGLLIEIAKDFSA
ncbi:leucyl aminopeptidase [Synchytrium microbalum]|uniref:Leucyl aminopeptidase n=1 Tax=Synchytrium microbalum TaxID=1806994 RepID=A0A507BU88_9FUNG|nr:leucyl aminopeptidase [Synchytrium microbalum]TPX32517.1 leucyl aminopeptidase [Synchytrium microbalum]